VTLTLDWDGATFHPIDRRFSSAWMATAMTRSALLRTSVRASNQTRAVGGADDPVSNRFGRRPQRDLAKRVVVDERCGSLTARAASSAR